MTKKGRAAEQRVSQSVSGASQTDFGGESVGQGEVSAAGQEAAQLRIAGLKIVALEIVALKIVALKIAARAEQWDWVNWWPNWMFCFLLFCFVLSPKKSVPSTPSCVSLRAFVSAKLWF